MQSNIWSEGPPPSESEISGEPGGLAEPKHHNPSERRPRGRWDDGVGSSAGDLREMVCSTATLRGELLQLQVLVLPALWKLCTFHAACILISRFCTIFDGVARMQDKSRALASGEIACRAASIGRYIGTRHSQAFDIKNYSIRRNTRALRLQSAGNGTECESSGGLCTKFVGGHESSGSFQAGHDEEIRRLGDISWS